ncbi:uncharacterized protein [Penaeus vannamei]|uniref:uncharacterized protein isoform X3 n=1 Tax=Penaeus vannamei TaxID=6689 RepID=UPI00387F6077
MFQLQGGSGSPPASRLAAATRSSRQRRALGSEARESPQPRSEQEVRSRGSTREVRQEIQPKGSVKRRLHSLARSLLAVHYFPDGTGSVRETSVASGGGGPRVVAVRVRDSLATSLLYSPRPTHTLTVPKATPGYARNPNGAFFTS